MKQQAVGSLSFSVGVTLAMPAVVGASAVANPQYALLARDTRN
jgi:hypothetical protein